MATTFPYASLSSRCDYCESSLDEFKRDVEKYLKKKSAESKSTAGVATMLRKVATTESNVKLQDCLFRCAATFAELDSYLSSYSECEEHTSILVQEAKSCLVTPLREVLLDQQKAATISKSDPLRETRLTYIGETAPIHSKLFEKHRLIYMKAMLRSLLYAELQYHSKVIEQISPLFECLSEVNENEQ